MPERIDLKTRLQNLGAEFYFERYVGQIELRGVDDPSIEEALALKKRNRLDVAANHFYTLSRESQDPQVRAEMSLELAQVLIDMNIYGQAKEHLRTARENTFLVPDEFDRAYLNGRFEEKSAWICDYEGKFIESLGHLENAESFLRSIPQGRLGQREESLGSSVTHFKGRAHMGIALQRPDQKATNVSLALVYFRKDLDRFKEMRKEGRPAPANEGSNNAWITRCLLEIGDLDLAEKYLERTRLNFEEFLSLKENSESPIMGHYFSLKGGLELKNGSFSLASQSFTEAYTIWVSKGGSLKGEGTALAGTAFSAWANRDFATAFVCGLRALKRYPYLLLRPNI